MDLRSYVKIKTIPGGQISDSRFIEGVVFRKNVAHKKMRGRVKEPRVLLLSCPIQFKGEHVTQGGGDRMSSLMTLIDQERLHLAIVVDKIVNLKPDVLVVQKTVSRIAQDALRDAGITLILNVKPSIMDRLARSTGGHILRSPDYVENSLLKREQLLGYCKDFEVKHFKEGSKRYTLMYFESSRTHRHGTICLRGAPKEILRSVKRVLRMAILVAHNLRLETKFLENECAMYPEEFLKEMMSFYERHEKKLASAAAETKSSGRSSSPASRRASKISRKLNKMHTLINQHKDPAERLISMSPAISVDLSEAYVRLRARQAYESLGPIVQSVSYGKFCRLTHNWQCEAPREHGHLFYSTSDITLGRFLEKNCFDIEKRCGNSKCRRNVLYHNRYLTHGTGRVHFTVKLLELQTARHLYENQLNKGLQRQRNGSGIEGSKNSQKAMSSEGKDGGVVNAENQTTPEGTIAATTASGTATTTATESSNSTSTAASQVAAAFSSAVAAARRAATSAAAEVAHSSPRSPSQHSSNVGGQQQSRTILMCSFCRKCDNRGPVMSLSEEAYNLSLGKFLDLTFYNHKVLCRAGSCPHPLHTSYVRQFVKGNMIAQFQYDTIRPFKIKFEHSIRYDVSRQQRELEQDLASVKTVTTAMSKVFLKRITEIQNYIGSLTAEESRFSEEDSKHISSTSASVEDFKCEVEVARKHFQTEISRLCTLRAEEPSFEFNRLRKTVFDRFHEWNYTLTRLRKPLIRFSAARRQQFLLSDSNNFLNGGGVSSPESKKRTEDEQLLPKSTPVSPQRNKKRVSPYSPQKQQQQQQQQQPTTTKEDDRVAPRNLQTATSGFGDADNATTAAVAAGGGRTGAETYIPSEITAPPEASVDMVTPPTTFVENLQANSETRSSVISIDNDETIRQHHLPSSSKLMPPPSNPITAAAAAAAEPSSAATTTTTTASSSSSLGTPKRALSAATSPSKTTTAAASLSTNSRAKSHDTGGASSSHRDAKSTNNRPKAPQPPTSGAERSRHLCRVIHPSDIKQEEDMMLTNADVEFLSSGAMVDSNLGVEANHHDDGNPTSIPCRVHMLLPKLLNDVQVPVFEDEASSIIAYTLASQEHAAIIQSSSSGVTTTEGGVVENTNNTVSGDDSERGGDTDRISSSSAAEESSSSSNNNKSKSASGSKHTSSTDSRDDWKSSRHRGQKPDIFSPSWYYTEPKAVEMILNEDSKSTCTHVFSDLSKSGPFQTNPSTITRFTCKALYARKFHALRRVYCGGEAAFIRSMSRCYGWNATGGKSGSTFSRTRCDRYIIKYVNKSEFKMLIDLAGPYFKFMAKACFRSLPTVLSKILGCYQVSWKRANGDHMKTLYAIVMPNVFYATPVTHIFDLKGSVRNRYVKTKPGETDRVLLDENFLEYTRGFPIPIEEKTKDEMRHAIRNDSKFLCDMEVVDYSVLVGLNESTRVMAIGIIDYVRQYTWERRIETGVKSMGMITGKASPTVISPENYKVRFQLATERYFMMAPVQTSRAGLKNLPTASKHRGSRKEGARDKHETKPL
mmetsp:Transcript_46987/g.77981  ORF Transcript_46987/g.77981 Transcript_46987/m.77981 type:complete len:1540 (-) Transcript_46987:280-4899(-)